MTKYAACITDDEGQSHLYALVETLEKAYEMYLEDQEIWFDTTVDNNERYIVHLHYPLIEVNFGSTNPITVTESTHIIGTYGQLESAFRIKYENEDSRWEITVEARD
jgi:hypothetical protein